MPADPFATGQGDAHQHRAADAWADDKRQVSVKRHQQRRGDEERHQQRRGDEDQNRSGGGGAFVHAAHRQQAGDDHQQIGGRKKAGDPGKALGTQRAAAGAQGKTALQPASLCGGMQCVVGHAQAPRRLLL